MKFTSNYVCRSEQSQCGEHGANDIQQSYHQYVFQDVVLKITALSVKYHMPRANVQRVHHLFSRFPPRLEVAMDGNKFSVCNITGPQGRRFEEGVWGVLRPGSYLGEATVPYCP